MKASICNPVRWRRLVWQYAVWRYSVVIAVNMGFLSRGVVDSLRVLPSVLVATFILWTPFGLVVRVQPLCGVLSVILYNPSI